MSRTDVFIFLLQLNLPLYVELMSSSSSAKSIFISRIDVVIFCLDLKLPLCLPLLSSVELSFLSCIDVFLVCLQLNLSLSLEVLSSSYFFNRTYLYLELMSSSSYVVELYVCISNWRLRLLSSVEIFIVSGTDVFVIFLQLILSLCIELKSSSFFIWSYLCIANCCLRLLSSVELTFVSRNDVVVFYLQLNSPLYF